MFKSFLPSKEMTQSRDEDDNKIPQARNRFSKEISSLYSLLKWANRGLFLFIFVLFLLQFQLYKLKKA